MLKGSVQMGGAFLCLSAFLQKRGRRFCFLGRFFVFLYMAFLVLTKEDDDDDENAAFG